MAGLSAFLDALVHSRKADIQDLAHRIQIEIPELGSEIKWNGPSFKAGEVNIATFRLFPDPNFQVILHCGSKKLPKGTDLTFTVEALDHRWADMTRCTIEVPSRSEVDGCIKAVRLWREVLTSRGLI
jgi:hypothetical protein